MQITILTMGTRGDTQPYIALGLALKKAGCGVKVAAFENFETFVKSYELDFYPIRGDVAKVSSSSIAKDAMKADNPFKFLVSFNQLKSYVFELQKDFFAACLGSDAIVYHPGVTIGYFAARYLNIPAILGTPFPMAPTREYPSLIFYNMPRLGGGFNLLTHKILEQIMWMASSSPVKEFWRQKFGHLPDHFACPYSKQTTKTFPTVISCSDAVFPSPKDWPEHVHNTGYWFLDEEPHWKPDDDLQDFLNQGAPPVYVGFGSIGDVDQAKQTTQMVIDALRLVGQRGVLATGWHGMAQPVNLAEDMLMLDNAPHSWLFPRMAAVVHHGGAGTTAAGLRAGVPTITIPHGNDQFAWGRRVYELGVGSKAIPRKHLSAEKLANAIQFAQSDKVRKSAKALGVKIRSESGAENAARIILQSCS